MFIYVIYKYIFSAVNMIYFIYILKINVTKKNPDWLAVCIYSEGTNN